MDMTNSSVDAYKEIHKCASSYVMNYLFTQYYVKDFWYIFYSFLPGKI
jgi:hypothetical protein